MSSPIVAILNTYSPKTGHNIAQIVIRSDGSLQLHGDEAMARHVVGKLTSQPFPAALQTPTLGQPLKRRGRPPKVR
jgi:hypothetical protein